MAKSPPSTAPAGRPYRSELRGRQADQTRQLVMDAALDLFVAKGWASTGMREVAGAAGVAIETVYSHFASKRGLLRAVVDTAVTGDAAPVPLAERPEFLAIGKGPRAQRIQAAARMLAAVQERTGPIFKLMHEAAYTDAEVASMLQDARDRQRKDVATGLGLLLGRTPTDEERDTVWAVASHDVRLLLLEAGAFTLPQYEAWLATTFERVIPRS